VFVGDDPATDTIADTSGPYSSFSQPSIDNTGKVTFYAERDGANAGIFTGPDPVTDRVIGGGDPLFGSTDAGDVAFSYRLANARYGIGIAAVPEPSHASGSLVAAALLLGMRALRRRSR
jgi:hypothetical protein